MGQSKEILIHQKMDMDQESNPQKELNWFSIRPGIYQHYKGRFYYVIGEVTEHETRNRMVLYIPLYLVSGTQVMTARDIESFKKKFRRIDP